MSKIYLIYLSALFVFTNTAINDSPCPQIFHYGYDNNGLYGVITLHTYPRDKDILLSVQFSIPDKIGYLGNIVPVHSGSEINSILDNNGPLSFKLNFPPTSSTPIINTINVNDDVICYSYNEIPGFYKVTLKYNLLSYTDKIKQANKQKEIEQKYATGISPCPDIFQYRTDHSGVHGLITLNYPAYSHADGSDIILKVEFSVSRKLPSENLGRIELLDSIKNTYTILKGRGTFRYKLHFPIQNPVPWINSIELSGRQICVGSSEYGGVYVGPITLRNQLSFSKDIQSVLSLRKPEGSGQSPCPGVFNYYRHGDKMSGLITVPDTYSLVNQKVSLSIDFSVLEKLNSDYIGKIELIEDVNTAYGAIKQNNPIHYRLLFPVQVPLPWINAIKVNSRIICSGSNDYGNYYTGPITLNNTLFFYQKPPSHPFIHSIDFQQQVEEEKYTNIQINQRPISTRRPIINTPTPSVNTPRPSFSFGVLPKPKPQNQQTNSRPHFDITQNKPSTEPSTRPTYSWNKKPSTEITTRPTYSWNKKPSTEVSTRPSRPWNNNPSTRPSYPWSTEVDKNTKYEEELFSIVNNTDNVEITDYHNIKTTTKITIRVNQDICGSTINDIVPLKAAQESQRGSYPWLSALFKQTTNGLTFLCAGNLITKKHVLTAAHCIGIKNPDNYLAVLGKYNLNNFNEDGTIWADIMKLFVHPDYVFDDIKKRDADVAILTLKEDVKYTDYIRPVCVFPKPMPLPLNKKGMVAGWGENEDGARPSTLEELVVTVVSNETCIRSNKKFKEIITDRTFCAGGREPGRPCKGDSGGGLFVPDNGKYYLRGIVSRSIGTDCDSFQYSLYTDVTKFYDWISNQIQT